MKEEGFWELAVRFVAAIERIADYMTAPSNVEELPVHVRNHWDNLVSACSDKNVGSPALSKRRRESVLSVDEYLRKIGR